MKKKLKLPPLRVLIVDEGALADTLALILNQCGCRAVPAHTGDEAIKIAEQTAFDMAFLELIFVECGMPIIRFAERIRELQPHCRILIWRGGLMSAYLESLPQEIVSQFEYIAKPMHPEEMFRLVRETDNRINSQ
jgi:two-component SAPR family response regulator